MQPQNSCLSTTPYVVRAYLDDMADVYAAADLC